MKTQGVELASNKPFSEQLGRFYAAPLALTPALVIVVLSLAAAVFVTPELGLIGVLAHLVLTVSALRYGLSLLQRFSFGDIDLDAFVADEEHHRDTVYNVIGALLLFGGAMTIMADAAPALSWVFYALLVLLAPAIVMQVSVRGSLLDVLRVDDLWRMISTIGGTYWWLLAMAFITSRGSRFLSLSLGKLYGAGFVSRFGGALVSNYALFVLCCMMGWALHRHAEEIDIATRQRRRERLIPEHLRGRQQRNGNMQDMLGRGDVEDALDVAAEQARLGINDPAAQERYFRLLQLGADESKLALQATRWLIACASARQADACVTIVKDWWVRNPQMLDHSPELFLTVAHLVLQGGAAQEALHMARHFQKVQRGSMLMPQSFLLEAGILYIHLREPEQAKGRLRELISVFPNSHQQIGEANALLVEIDATSHAPRSATSNPEPESTQPKG